MDLKGDVNIMRHSDYYVNDLINLDFPKVADNVERDAISNPERGDLVITLSDYSLNIYDDNLGFWKKLKANHSMDRGVSTTNEYSWYWCTMVAFNISTLGSAEVADGQLTRARYRTACFSNAGGDIGFTYGGWQQNTTRLNTFQGAGTTYINEIDYFQISTTHNNASLFGEAEYRDYYRNGTSNAELNRGIIAGGSQDADRISVVNMQTKGESEYFGNMAQGHGTNPFALSNYTNDRAIFGGGASSITKMTYVTISTNSNSVLFGNLSSCYDPGGCSNGELDRGVICLGSSNAMETITISTLGNAMDFGDLTVWRRNQQPCSNRIRNRAVVVSGTQYYWFLQMDYFDISTFGDANEFGDLPTERHLDGTKAVSNS